MEKLCQEQTDQDLWLTITDAISMELIGHNRLNWFSPSGLLVKWSINPSPSLKCMVTDSGKLLPAGLFASTVCSLPAGQIYLVGKHLSKRSDVSSPVTIDRIMFYKEPSFTKREFLKGGWGLQKNAMKLYSTWSRTRPLDFGNPA